MSFGFSPTDILTLLPLTTKAYKGWKSACGDYTEITGSLHTLRGHLKRANAALDSGATATFRTKEELTQWKALMTSCTDTVSALDKVVIKFEPIKSRRSNWRRLQLGTKNLDDIHRSLMQRTSDITLFLNITAIGALGRMEPKLDGLRDIETLVRDIPDIRATVDTLAERSRRDSSVMTYRSGEGKRHDRQTALAH